MHGLPGDQCQATVDRWLGDGALLDAVRPSEQHLTGLHGLQVAGYRLRKDNQSASPQEVLTRSQFRTVVCEERIVESERAAVTTLEHHAAPERFGEPREVLRNDRHTSLVLQHRSPHYTDRHFESSEDGAVRGFDDDGEGDSGVGR